MAQPAGSRAAGPAEGRAARPADGRAPATAAAAWGPSRHVVPVLDALVEGAWISVIEAAVAVAGGRPLLGPLPFAVAVGLSLYWTRRDHDPSTAMTGLLALYVGAYVAAGAIAAGPNLTSDLPRLLIDQPAALLSILAVFRGTRHANRADDDLVVGSLLRWGLPLLALPWLYGTALAEPDRSAFVASAFPATLLFASAGLLGLGLARLDALAQLSGVDWRHNRAWVVVLAGVLAVMTLIAVPAALLLGTPIAQFLAGLVGPFSIVLAPVAAVVTAVMTVVVTLLSPLIDFLMSLIHPAERQPQPVQGTPGSIIPPAPGGQSEVVVYAFTFLVVVLVVILVAVLLWISHRRPARTVAVLDAALEEREYRLPHIAVRLPHIGLPRRSPRPTTASGAYVAFLGDLEGRPDLARLPAEPPSSHAARLRERGLTDPRAALLAADYQLERYALASLTARETRRALARLSRLREVLRTRATTGRSRR